MLTLSDTAVLELKRDVWAFAPEVVVIAGVVVMLLLKLFGSFRRTHLGGLALVFAAAALACSYMQWRGSAWFPYPDPLGRYFTGLLAYDHLTIFMRMFLTGFAVSGVILSLITGIPDREDSADFYVLFLGATLGMMLMSSSNHLLMVFIAVEMASLPSYALAGYLKGKRPSSEASLKYVVYGSGAAGVMLYGMSLIAGRFGTGYLPDVARALSAVMAAGADGAVGPDLVSTLGLFFIFIGLAFKLSAVPFHFWCPDVFEGAAAEVGAFLSVASKGAAVALTGRLFLTLAGASGDPMRFATIFAPPLAVFAAVTATFGNLAAYSQTNLKRLLAYSTIAHAGYMLMGVSLLNHTGMSAVLFYLVTYLFMNMGAFAVVAAIRNATGSEDLRDYAGLVYRAPLATVCLAVFMISLLGLPPLSGFAAKFQIFQGLYTTSERMTEAGAAALGTVYFILLVIGGLNTVFSAFYYLRVMKVTIIDKPEGVTDVDEVPRLALPGGARTFVAVMAAATIYLGLAWDFLARAGDKGMKYLHGLPAVAEVAK